VTTQLYLVVVVVVVIIPKGNLKAETESEIVAAQDQALNTKYYVTLRTYRKQPYWALHTYFGKC